MYKCCIFDLDGTLVNSIKALTYTVNLTLHKYGLAPITETYCRLFVGDGYKKLIERALIHCGDEKLINYQDAIITYSQYFKLHCLHEVTAYDGITEMLDYLKINNIKIAVLTNKPHQRALDNIYKIFGKTYFDFIQGEIPNIKIKPDPEGALIITKALNVEPKDCLYIGDTSTDMKTGLNANMDTIGVTWGFRDRLELEAYNPKFIIDNPKQIIDIIKG